MRRLLVVSAATLLVLPAALHAQQAGRSRVLIPYFEPLEGADDDFGKDASEELRELIDGLATHVAMAEGEIRDEVRKFDRRMEDLDCTLARQLASLIDVPVAVCASYTEHPDESWVVNAWIHTIATSEAFELEEFTVDEDGEEAAAMQIFTQFDRYNTQIRATMSCQDYAASEQWANALPLCEEALEINPNAVATRFLRGQILYGMENFSEALREFERVLALNPLHEEALQRAGYISAVQGQDESLDPYERSRLEDDAHGYYSRYLAIDPGDDVIRMNIAYTLAQAGAPVGAMQLIKAGLDVNPASVDLWDQYGGFDFRAALDVQREWGPTRQGGGGLTPEVAELYREAITAYEKVFEARGAETEPDRLSDIITAYIQLDDLRAAIETSERVLQTHAQEERIWTLYADALQTTGRVDDAIAALDEVLKINPDHPNAALRQGSWLIQAGRLQDAAASLSDLAANDPAQADQAATMILSLAYTNGYQKDDFAYALQGFTAAKELPNLSETMIHQLNFWHGDSLRIAAILEQEPRTLETARATLPKLQEALQLLGATGEYPASVDVDLPERVEQIGFFIEIQEAIIRRGR